MASGNRSTIFPGVPFTFPEPVGTATIKYRNDDLEWLEELLEPELDKLNDRIADGRGPVDDITGEPVEFPFESVWDALEQLVNRRPMRTVGALLRAGLSHRHNGLNLDVQRAKAADEVGQLPPSLYSDDDLVRALWAALRHAFGDAGDDTGDPPPPAATEADVAV